MAGVVAALVVGPSAPGRASEGYAEQVDLAVAQVAGGFSAPLLVTHAGDGTGRLFVAERGGLVYVVRNGRRRSRPFLDMSGKTLAGGEQGLLGLAFHPNYERNRRLYVNYTGRSGNTVIASYRRDKRRPERVNPKSRRVVLRIKQPFANHNGGAIEFGSDGYLHIATGDGGSGGDPQGNGQRLDTLLGKILRIDVDRRTGDRRYSIPPDNPFGGTGGRGEIWAYGLRNPWRFSFDDFPDMAGLYFFGDFCSGRIWSVQADGPPSQEPVEMLDTNHSISSFGESEDGEMFMTDLSGTLYRLVDSS